MSGDDEDETDDLLWTPFLRRLHSQGLEDEQKNRGHFLSHLPPGGHLPPPYLSEEDRCNNNPRRWNSGPEFWRRRGHIHKIVQQVKEEEREVRREMEEWEHHKPYLDHFIVVS